MSHTKGPWHMASNANDKICVWFGASLIAKVEHFPHEGATTNANLIAAAPEMLEALEKIRPLLEASDGEVWVSAKELVKKVISKARGL